MLKNGFLPRVVKVLYVTNSFNLNHHKVTIKLMI